MQYGVTHSVRVDTRGLLAKVNQEFEKGYKIQRKPKYCFFVAMLLGL